MYQKKLLTCASENRNVLIVDDNQDFRHLMLSIMGREHISGLAVSSGLDAIDECAKNLYSLIVMDIQMPGIDGWETAKRIRESGFDGDIIACSANGYSNAEFENLNLHFTDFLQKPFSATEFLASIN